MEYDAELRNWFVMGNVVYGSIYGDKKGRFEDGTEVWTSIIVSLDETAGILKTENSTYKLMDKANGAI